MFLSSTEGGPADFCVQLESLSRQLEEVMEAANTVPLVPVAAGLVVPGTPCLARYTEDTTIYRCLASSPSPSTFTPHLHPITRHPSPSPPHIHPITLHPITLHPITLHPITLHPRAVVLKRDGALAKVYYLDYGNSESLPLSSIFALPPAHTATQMLSVRCR